jgi:long-chain acyl-CoA synthetase
MTGSILESWRRLVRADPGAPALIDASAGKTWSRGELDRLSAEWAAAAKQPLAGRLVLFAEPNGAAWLQVILGLFRMGAVAAPLDAGEPLSWQLATAKKIGASFLWSMGRFFPIDGRRRPFRDGRKLVKLTSGSTGEPRAVPFTDCQMLADGRQICATMGIRPEDINLGLVPFGHSYGLGNLVIPLLTQGTAIASLSSPLPHVLEAAVERWRITILPGTPAVLRAMVETAVAPAKIRSLRTVISAGSPLPSELAQSFRARFGLVIHNFYGSSETGGIAYDRTGDATLDGSGVGTPLKGVRLSFGRGRRFTVASRAVFTLGNRRKVGEEGVHCPSDFARIGKGGVLRLLGRAGRMVKVGGRRLDPAEVERVIKELAGVRDALVTQHPKRTDVLAAAVAGQASAEAVRESLALRLASWKVPRKLIVLPAFPLTARGKPDTRRLRELLAR